MSLVLGALKALPLHQALRNLVHLDHLEGLLFFHPVDELVRCLWNLLHQLHFQLFNLKPQPADLLLQQQSSLCAFLVLSNQQIVLLLPLLNRCFELGNLHRVAVVDGLDLRQVSHLDLLHLLLELLEL